MAAAYKVEGVASVLYWPMPNEKEITRTASKRRSIAALYDGSVCGAVRIGGTGHMLSGSPVVVARNMDSARELLEGVDGAGVNHVLQVQVATKSPNLIMEQTDDDQGVRSFTQPRHPEDSETDRPEYSRISFFKLTPETEYIFIKEHGRLLDYSEAARDCLYPVWAAVPVGEPAGIPEKYRFLGAAYSGSTPAETIGQMVFKGESGTWYVCQVYDSRDTSTRAWFTSSTCIEHTGNLDVSQYVVSAYAGVLTDSSGTYGPQPLKDLPPECFEDNDSRQMFNMARKPYGLNLLRGDSQCIRLNPAKVRIPPYSMGVISALNTSLYTYTEATEEPCGALLPRGPVSQLHGVGVLREFMDLPGARPYLLASVPSDFVPIIYDGGTTGTLQRDYGTDRILWDRVPSEVMAVITVILKHMARAGFKKIMLGKVLYEGLSPLAERTGIKIQPAQVVAMPEVDLIKDHPGLVEMTDRLSCMKSLRWVTKNVGAQEADAALTKWEERREEDGNLAEPVDGILLPPRQSLKLYTLTALKRYINHRWDYLNIHLGIY